MSAKPILFSAPMVRALLAGNKTQTRRIVKWQPNDKDQVIKFENGWLMYRRAGTGWCKDTPCPYGRLGDLLWVRETWADVADASDDAFKRGAFWPQYRATSDANLVTRWRPSIYMPRWASRITLRITDVRVERLQEISEDDAMAEGIALLNGRYTYNDGMHESRRDSYAALWESINGHGSWDANLLVWVISFDMLKQNIDTVAA